MNRIIIDKETGEYEEIGNKRVELIGEGDRIIRESSIKYLDKRKKNEYSEDKFIKSNIKGIKEIIKYNLSSNDYKVLLYLVSNIRYNSNKVSKENGSIVKIKDIIKDIGISKGSSYNSINKLIESNIIKKEEDGYVVNPKYFYKGNKVYSELKEKFRNE